MLRTSLRKVESTISSANKKFLSSNAQDFIEEHPQAQGRRAHPFLSSNAQDFIEDRRLTRT